MLTNTISIAVYNEPGKESPFLDGALEALRETTEEYEVIITDTYRPRISLAEGWNTGARKGKGKFITVLNDDVIPSQDWLKKQTDYLEANPHVGVVSPSLTVCANNQKETFGAVEHPKKNFAEYTLEDVNIVAARIEERFSKQVQKKPILCGCSLTFRRELFEELEKRNAPFGCFDERFFPMYGEDDYFCDWVHFLGFEMHWLKYAFVHHIGRQTQGKLPDLDRGYTSNLLKRLRMEFQRNYGRK